MTSPDSSKRPLGFVNRRGHSQGDIPASELADLSIDDQPVVTDPVEAKQDDTTTAPKRTSKKVKKDTTGGTDKPVRRKRSLAWSRKRSLILVAAIILLVAIPVLIGEILRGQYLASAHSAQKAVGTIVAQDILPTQKKDVYTAKQLAAATDKLEAVRDDMCPGALLDNVALLYPRAKDAHETCIAERTKIASVVTAQRDITNQFAYIERVNAVFVRVGTPSDEAFAVVATQQSNWQSVQDELKKLNAPDTMKTAHEQLLTAVASINDGWSKLNVASNDQNAASFQAAEAQLAKGYDAVRATKAAYLSAVTDKQAMLTTAARNL